LISLTSCLIVEPIEHISNTDFPARESFSYDIAIRKQKQIVIEGVNGSISIIGEPACSMVKIWGERIVKSDNYEDARAHLKSLKVQISDKIDKISVETEQPTVTYGRNYQVIYNIIIPDNWDVEIENVNGEVAIDSLNGDICVELVNGNVILREILGNIDLGVTNGQVYGKVTLPIEGFCRINAVNGQIQLSIPKTTSAEFDAKVTNGTINVSNLMLKNMVSSRKSVSGILGSGQGLIHVETVNGMISVSGF